MSAQWALPPDVRIESPGPEVPAPAAAFSGIWAGGAWDGILPHVVIVEQVSPTGNAAVISSWGDAPDWQLTRGFTRVQGRIDHGRLLLEYPSRGARAEYVIDAQGALQGTYTRGSAVGKIVLTHTILEHLDALAPRPPIALHEESLRIPVTYVTPEGGTQTWSLEATLFRPQPTGRFPVAVFNHGSTGPGQIPVTLTLKFPIVARYFVDQGWAVLVPMRRGRGQSEGPNQEGYQCGREASGIDCAVEDLDGVFRFLREQPWANPHQILIGGVSRGGMLAVVYAGRRPEAVQGVINVVGGWMGERCVPDANGQLFSGAARTATVPMLWLYADHDPYYSASAIRRYRAAFEEAGGRGPFYLFPEIGGNGHYLANKPLFWRPALDAYLQELGLLTAPQGESHQSFPHAREEGTR
ncbi:MAG: dienelactone hydrolase family protein [Candidatus Entotheonellia bacterium]